uniref:Prolactin, gene 2 n=1 Tax=Xenopus tropicalis TaxID=8364 RepID=F6TFJ8_XENTR
YSIPGSQWERQEVVGRLTFYVSSESTKCHISCRSVCQLECSLSHSQGNQLTGPLWLQDQRFSQGRQFLGKSMSSCHTSLLSTPEDKDQALQRHHDDLINLVQKLLRSWNQPLQHLALEAPDNMASKVKEVEEHAKILQGGIDRIAGRVSSYPPNTKGIDILFVNFLFIPMEFLKSYALYHLLHCFRRDSNKIDNYLKILRCRMVHASNC